MAFSLHSGYSITTVKHFGVDKWKHYSDNSVMKALDRAIEIAGGLGKLADAIGEGQSTVSNWRVRGTVPSAKKCVAIERATGVSRREFYPDSWQEIWPELAGAA
ncbi:MAG: hypothetical protein RL758_250 [Pseudomonadota bacterium]